MLLYGAAYWRGLIEWLRSTMLAEGKIAAADIDLLVVTDSPAEVRDLIVKCTQEQCWRPVEEQARAATRQALAQP